MGLKKSDIEKMEAKRDVKGLVKALKNYDSNIRTAASEALVKIGDAHAVEELISVVFKSKEYDVHWRAADALAKIGGRAVDALVPALKNSNADIRASVANILGNIGDKRPVDELIALLQDLNADVRAVAAEALVKIGDDRAMEGLLAALKSPDGNIRASAAGALAKMKTTHKADETVGSGPPANVQAPQEPSVSPPEPTGASKVGAELPFEQLQKIYQSDGHFEEFTRDIEKQLRKLGWALSYTGLFGHNKELKQGGVALARFNDNEGYSIALILGRQYNLTAPWMFPDKYKELYWTTAIWGMTVQTPTPFTLLFKEVNRGFMKGQAKVFLPYQTSATASSFNEKELLSSPLLQTNVVAALNSDKDIGDNIAKLSLGCSVALGTKTEVIRKDMWGNAKSWTTTSNVITLKAPDIAGKCVIVPAGDETAVFLRNYGTYGDPKSILKAMAAVRKSLLANPQTEKVFGSFPSDAQWINMAFSFIKMKT